MRRDARLWCILELEGSVWLCASGGRARTRYPGSAIGFRHLGNLTPTPESRIPNQLVVLRPPDGLCLPVLAKDRPQVLIVADAVTCE